MPKYTSGRLSTRLLRDLTALDGYFIARGCESLRKRQIRPLTAPKCDSGRKDDKFTAEKPKIPYGDVQRLWEGQIYLIFNRDIQRNEG